MAAISRELSLVLFFPGVGQYKNVPRKGGNPTESRLGNKSKES